MTPLELRRLKVAGVMLRAVRMLVALEPDLLALDRADVMSLGIAVDSIRVLANKHRPAGLSERAGVSR